MNNFELHPRTDGGRKAVELAAHHAVEIRARAAEHDHDGTFPYEAIDAMKASGFLTGLVSTPPQACDLLKHCFPSVGGGT